MNAYEMSDELLRDNTQLTVKAAYMLRQQANDVGSLNARLKQQADRIAELQGELSRYELRDLEQTSRIAILENQLDKCSHHEAMAHQGGYELGKASQLKELSDEEIEEVMYKCDWAYDPVAFARAILKKASKK